MKSKYRKIHATSRKKHKRKQIIMVKALRKVQVKLLNLCRTHGRKTEDMVARTVKKMELTDTTDNTVG